MKTVTAADIKSWCQDNQCHAHFDSNGHIITGHDSEIGQRRTMDELSYMIGIGATDGFAVTLDADGYYSLADVMRRAFEQASTGKGKERHANALPFDQQPMQTIAAAHGVGFLTGQAAKKSQEAMGLPHDAKIRELLGAIVYLAGAVIFLERVKPAVAVDVEHQLGSQFMTSAKPGSIVQLKPGEVLFVAKPGSQTEGMKRG